MPSTPDTSHSTSHATPLTERPAWKALARHFQAVQGTPLRELFASDPERGTRLIAEATGLFVDYSKHRITDETMSLLLALANECGVADRMAAMFGGEKINVTEQRAVLHVALRAPRDAHILVDGVDVVPEVHEVLDRMSTFSDSVRTGNGWATPGSASATS